MRLLVLVTDETVVDGGHDEVGDTATCITKATGESIGGTDNILVEEAGRPDLAGDEGAAKNADEEADGIQAGHVFHAASAEGRDGASEEDTGKGLSGAKLVTAGPADGSNEKGGDKADDVRG